MFRYRYGNVESYSIEQIWLVAQTVTGPVKRAKPARKLEALLPVRVPAQAMGGRRMRAYLMRGGRIVLMRGGRIVLLRLAADAINQHTNFLGAALLQLLVDQLRGVESDRRVEAEQARLPLADLDA